MKKNIFTYIGAHCVSIQHADRQAGRKQGKLRCAKYIQVKTRLQMYWIDKNKERQVEIQHTPNALETSMMP